jgi:hypothetical protein
MRVPLKHKPGEHAVHRPARSWHRGPDPDAPISFADIAELPDPDWIGRSQQAGFALDAELLEPLELTDWSARIAADWKAIDGRWEITRMRIAAGLMEIERGYAMGVCMLVAPFLANVDDLLKEQLPAWRVLNAMPTPEAPIATAKAEVA